MLNLRLFGFNVVSSASLSEPAFAQDRVLGNIGAPLDFGQWESMNGDADGCVESGESQESHDGEGKSVSVVDNANGAKEPKTGMSEVRVSWLIRHWQMELALT